MNQFAKELSVADMSSFSRVNSLRGGINKVAGDLIPRGATVLNLSGLPLTLPNGVVCVDVRLSDVWGTRGRVKEDEVRELVQALLDLRGKVHVRAVCNAGRNRSRVAATLYCIMFGFREPANGEPETNTDFQNFLKVARERAKDSAATAADIGEAVVSAV